MAICDNRALYAKLCYYILLQDIAVSMGVNLGAAPAAGAPEFINLIDNNLDAQAIPTAMSRW